jgi:long-chain acyl-CoA synthetase
MGIYAKNREEWIVSDLACILNDVTSVPFYDTLGDESLEFIINQTNLTTMCCTADKIKTLSKLKRNHKIDSLVNLIILDQWDDEETRRNCPLNLIYYHDAIDQGKRSETELRDPDIKSIL